MPKPRGIPGLKTSACLGKQSCLPPKSPGPVINPPSYVDYNFGHCIGPIGVARPNENSRHQHTSSESVLVDEQLSWLDDLLDEPETPTRRGTHRRSSSDSFAYVDMCDLSSNLDNIAFENFRNRTFDHLKGQNRRKEFSLNTANNLCSSHAPISTTKEPALASTEEDQEESAQDVQGPSEEREETHAKQAQAEMETKRVKQQFAQRSRVMKLQYISELERNVQALQAEGWEMSAEIEFLSQQSLILSLENKALKQRFDGLSQEHLLKQFEQEMLEREIARLRSFFQHHQQQLQHTQKQPQRQRHRQNHNFNHVRGNSRDLDMQFSNLSVKRKDARPGHGARGSPPQIHHT